MRNTLALLVVTFSLLAPGGAVAVVEASEGSVDTEFGEAGKVVQPFGAEYQMDADLLSDGRTIALGAGQMMAMLPSGLPDPSFGDGGSLSVAKPPGSEDSGLGTVLVDSQGRLLIVGNCTFPTQAGYLQFYSLAAAVRYTPDGHLDTSFGDDGFAVVDPGLRAEPLDSQPQISLTDAALDAKDRIVFAGINSGSRPYKGSFIGTTEPFVARLTAEGEIDRSFSGDGVLPVRATQRIEELAPDAGGGVYVSATKQPRRVLFHLGEDGEIDRGFGEEGFRMQPADATDGPVLQLPSGRLLIFRYLSESPARHLPVGVQIKRLLPDGSRDRGFGTNGEARVRLPRFDRYTLAVDNEERILIEASQKRRERQGQRPAASAALALIRLRANGHLDRGFGHEGVIRVPYPYRWEVQPQTLDVVGDEALLGAYWYGGDEEHGGRTFARIHLGA
jgi:uncharacterized delta-60 repeat protein